MSFRRNRRAEISGCPRRTTRRTRLRSHAGGANALHPQGQAACDACREIAEHVFARRLVVHRDDVAEAFGQHRPQGSVAACRPQHERMVETGNDLLVDNAFQDTEVHHHPTLGVRVVVRRAPFHGHEQPVGMPVDLTARPSYPSRACAASNENSFVNLITAISAKIFIKCERRKRFPHFSPRGFLYAPFRIGKQKVRKPRPHILPHKKPPRF